MKHQLSELLHTLGTIIAIIVFAITGCVNEKVVIGIVADDESPDAVSDIPLCQTGDVLSTGQMCLDEGTDATFMVLESGNGSYTSESGLLFESTDVLDATGSTLNDQSYNFIARRQGEGVWKIERVSSDAGE